MHYISAGYEMIWGRSVESLYANPQQWVKHPPEERERVFAVFATLVRDRQGEWPNIESLVRRHGSLGA